MERGRAARPDIELGVCGEHGGDPRSIAFFEKVRGRGHGEGWRWSGGEPLAPTLSWACVGSKAVIRGLLPFLRRCGDGGGAGQGQG